MVKYNFAPHPPFKDKQLDKTNLTSKIITQGICFVLTNFSNDVNIKTHGSYITVMRVPGTENTFSKNTEGSLEIKLRIVMVLGNRL